MIVLQIHQFKHRLLSNGVMQSSPSDSEQWQQRSPESMELTGGDYSLIEEMINRLFYAIPAERQLPFAQKKEQKVVEEQVQ